MAGEMSEQLVGALQAHLSIVEAFGNAERGFEAWLTTQARNRDLVLPGEKKRRDEAWDAVCESARNLVTIVQSNRLNGDSIPLEQPDIGSSEVEDNNKNSEGRKDAFREALVQLVNQHIRESEICPEEVATVFAEEAKSALDCLGWKPHAQRAASEHLVVVAACLKDGRVIPVPSFEILFPEEDSV